MGTIFGAHKFNKRGLRKKKLGGGLLFGCCLSHAGLPKSSHLTPVGEKHVNRGGGGELVKEGGGSFKVVEARGNV